MQRHGIEWEQLGTHREHLSVLDHKKQMRSEEVKALEQSIAKLQQKQVDIQAVEQIVAKPVPLSSKVKLEPEDYKTLVTAAKAYVVQEKKERKLQKLLQAAEKTIEGLKTKIADMKRELDSYRSVRGQLKAGTLEKENGELRRRNTLCQAIIEKRTVLPICWAADRKTSKGVICGDVTIRTAIWRVRGITYHLPQN